MTDEEIIEIMKRECANQWGLDLVANVLPFARAIIEAERSRHAWIARNGCLVPPDGGSPSDTEREMCEQIARSIENDR